MKDEKLVTFNAFRQICLSNAEDALKGARHLCSQQLNHIAYHLAVLSLEETGKIFMAWIKLKQKEDGDKDNPKVEMDDHVKKLFYAIWGPSIGSELITKTQIQQNQIMATALHERRLATLYGDISDTGPSALKISDEETAAIVAFADARLELARIDGEVDEERKPSPDMEWLAQFMELPEKRDYIFGKEAQEKLIEFGDVNPWVQWLKASFESEQKDLADLIQTELKRGASTDLKQIIPKWEIAFTVTTPSHSIRPKALSAFNAKHPVIKLFPGKDKHTLLIKNMLGTNVPVTQLWQQGWFTSKLFVAALNIAGGGIFYWNTVIDTEKYYDSITDLETNKKLLALLKSHFRIDWREKKLTLKEQDLHVASLVLDYLVTVTDAAESKPVIDYLSAVAMLAKTDIHLRLEASAFVILHDAFCNAVRYHQALPEKDDAAEVGYHQIDGLARSKEEFDRIIAKAKAITQNDESLQPLTLQDVFIMKHYFEFYMVTIAVRKLKDDKHLKLV